MTETAKAPAIGYSITANLNGDRQVVFQHFVDEAAGAEGLNRQIDLIMGAIDRQQAKYRLPELRDEQTQLRGQIEQAEKDLAMVEADYAARVEQRNQQVIKLQGDVKLIWDAGYKAHVEGGRRGGYEPRGNDKSRIDAIHADLQKLIEAAVRDDAERDAALANLRENNVKRQMRIAAIDGEIAELQAKV